MAFVEYKSQENHDVWIRLGCDEKIIQMSTLPGTVSVIYSDLIPVTVSVSAEKLHHITSRATGDAP